MGNLQHRVSILQKEWLTHNVICLKLERPTGFGFTPGQAIELTIDEETFLNDAAPFTLTGLQTAPYLELIIKVYPQHNGMTLGLSKLKEGDDLLIGDAWDSFSYKGQGTYIAGGSGITPFIAILRDLNAKGGIIDQTLLFANKSEKDIFMKEELSEMKGLRFVNILSEEKTESYGYGGIGKGFLQTQISDYNQFFYLCGPGLFSLDIKEQLIGLGADENKIFSEY